MDGDDLFAAFSAQPATGVVGSTSASPEEGSRANSPNDDGSGSGSKKGSSSSKRKKRKRCKLWEDTPIIIINHSEVTQMTNDKEAALHQLEISNCPILHDSHGFVERASPAS